jgi:Ig-like domain CHU_C associated
VLLLLLPLFCYGQVPVFNQNIGSSSTFVCKNGSLTFSATASNANFYQFQKVINGQWQNISGGSGQINSNAFLINYGIYGINESLSVRLYIKNNQDSIFSSTLNFTPQEPIINFQPIDLQQCNGLNAIFKTAATGVGTLTYAWQTAPSSSGTFATIGTSTKYTGQTTNSLTVRTLINGDQGTVYRCLIRDQNQCEKYTDIAQLYVNQLSTVIQPLTSPQFCEGDSLKFYSSGYVGVVDSYKWQMRPNGNTTYTDLNNSTRIIGANADTLKVKNILTSENAFRIKVLFKNNIQNNDGTSTIGTCEKIATRTGYIINPRPVKPIQIDSISRCGTGILTTNIALGTGYYWFEDSTKSAMITNNNTFLSPNLISSKTYFYNQKDTKGCFSNFRKFKAIVNDVPKIHFPNIQNLCFDANSLAFQIDSSKYLPLKISIQAKSPFPGFQNITDIPFQNSIIVPLPNPKSPGIYNLSISVLNQFCKSDTSILNLGIFPKTAININTTPKVLCEGSELKIQPLITFDAPASFQWYKNGIELPSQTDSVLNIQTVLKSDSGYYSLRINAKCGIAKSDSLKLTVLEKPKIIQQPQSLKVCSGTDAIFTISATGSGVLTYKWFVNNILQANNSNVLTLNGVNGGLDNAKIKCIVNSACEPSIISDEVVLTVENLPSEPSLNNEMGYCQKNGFQKLANSNTTAYDYIWTNSIGVKIDSISLSNFDTLAFKVKSQSPFGCKSIEKEIQIIISPTFDFEAIADQTALCISGIFNRTSTITANPITTLEATDYNLKKNGVTVLNNTDGYFENIGTGNYKIEGKKDFCTVSKSITISEKFTELAQKPTGIDAAVCKGIEAILKASSLQSGGTFKWWLDATDPFSIADGNQLTVSGLSQNTSRFVSYVKTDNNGSCETDRVEVKATLNPNLLLSLNITPNSCSNTQNGQVKVNLLNGKNPYFYTFENTSNTSGIFQNLLNKSYTLNVKDSLGCTKDTIVVIGLGPQPSFLTQALDISRCKGNTANFVVTTSGNTDIAWEKSINSGLSYTTILGETSNTLKLLNIGSNTFPHLSKYRPKISNSNGCELIGNPVTLHVNSVTGSTQTLTKCSGENVELNLSNFTITGTVKTHQWTKRPGSTGSYLDVLGANQTNLNISNAKLSDAGYYSNRLIFDNGDGSTCTISTSSVSTYQLKIDSLPKPTISGNQNICLGQSSTLTALNCSDIIQWSSGQTGSIITITPIISTKYTATCNKGTCSGIASDSLFISVNNSSTPLPINSTPLSKIVGDTLKFTAQGLNLKWFADSITTVVLPTAPIQTAIGNYTYWVSQTLNLCESPRLKIQASILPKLDITLQPTDFTNCKGNSASFIVTATGQGLTYIWQRQKPGETQFVDLTINDLKVSQINTNNLKLTTIGDVSNPHLSKYRCKITEGNGGIIYSSMVTLYVNSVTGSLPNKVVCVGANFEQNINQTHTVIGQIISIQWQGNTDSTSWENLKDSLGISGSKTSILNINSAKDIHNQQYRNQFIFSSTSGTCTENTDLMNLTVVLPPEKPQDYRFEFCQHQKDDNWKLYPVPGVKFLYYSSLADVNPLPKIPEISLQNPGLALKYYATYKDEECPSPKASIEFYVNPLPDNPKNNTVAEIEEGENLVFGASGQNLKWYANSSTKIFLTTNPIEQKVGKYDYFVSQTNEFDCESEKTKIVSEIVTGFAISTQPQNQENCDGNTVTFGVKIKGETNPSYQWQIFDIEKNEFINLSGEISKDLKIPDAGISPFIKDSKYRCQISNDKKVLITNTVSLKVNSIAKTFPNISLCEGDSIKLDSIKTSINGSSQKITWQEKTGSSYATIFTQTTNNQIFKPTKSNDYRIQVEFLAGNSTCQRTSSTFKLKLNPKPTRPILSEISVCDNNSIEEFKTKLPAFSVLENMSFANTQSVNQLPNDLLLYQKTTEGCRNESYAINLVKRQSPSGLENPKQITVCKYSDIENTLNEYLENYAFFDPKSQNGSSISSIQINNSQIQNLAFQIAKKDINGCYSNKTETFITIENCYFEPIKDTCIFRKTNLNSKSTNDYFTEESKIYATLLNTEKAYKNVDFRVHFTAFETNGSARIDKFSLSAAIEISNENKPTIRVYFPITQFEKNIKYYAGLIRDSEEIDICQPSISLNCIENSILLNLTEDKKEYYADFKIEKWGAFKINISKEISETLLIENKTIRIKDYNSLKTYDLYKSTDKESWFLASKNITETYTDNKLLSNSNFYKIKTEYSDKTCVYSNTVSIENQEITDNSCYVFSNPNIQNDLIKFYHQNADKNNIKILTLDSKLIPIEEIVSKYDYLEIKTKSVLESGNYVIHSKNTDNKNCTFRFIVAP